MSRLVTETRQVPITGCSAVGEARLTPSTRSSAEALKDLATPAQLTDGAVLLPAQRRLNLQPERAHLPRMLLLLFIKIDGILDLHCSIIYLICAKDRQRDRDG